MDNSSSSRPSLAWIAGLLVAFALAAGGGWLAARHFADPVATVSQEDRQVI